LRLRLRRAPDPSTAPVSGPRGEEALGFEPESQRQACVGK
jgi:hypothetical protein